MPQHHKIKLGNIVQLLKCLLETIKNSYFVFVVAEDRVDDYCTPHLVPDSGLISLLDETFNLQHWLIFDKENMLVVVIESIKESKKMDKSDYKDSE